MHRYVVLVCALGLVVGCAANGDEVVADVASTTAATAPTAPTSSTRAKAATTSSISTPESPSTTTEDALSVSDVAGWVQDWLDANFDSEIDWMLVGSSEIRCSDSGSVLPGDVFACQMVPRPAPGFELETAGVVVYVLDNLGRAVWRIGDVPDSTADLHAAYEAVPDGLYCRDLASQDLDVALFHSDSGSSEDGFFWSLVYWALEGQPDRMDADHNGIPCESLYDPAVVTAVLEGGPIGSHEPPPLGLALRPSGLGPIDFGTKGEGGVESLEYYLGPADSDITSHRSEVEAPPGGACYGGYACDEFVRVLGWDSLGLWVVISDLWLQPGHAVPPQPIPMTFVSYGYTGGNSDVVDTPEGIRQASLSTAEGIGIGSTAADLEAAYGASLSFGLGCGETAEFYVSLDDGFIAGSLIGVDLDADGRATVEPINPEATVASISAGAGGSC